MYDTRDFKKGLKIEIDSQPYVILDFQHVSPGKGSAFTRVKIRNLKTGSVLEPTIKSGDKVGKPNLDERNVSFLYKDSQGFTFMDTTNYDQFTLSKEDVGDNELYLLDNSEVKVLFYEGRAISVEVPTFVELTVKETDPAQKGDTVQGALKKAVLETGLTDMLPLHINEGDLLRIDSREGPYVERVRK